MSPLKLIFLSQNIYQYVENILLHVKVVCKISPSWCLSTACPGGTEKPCGGYGHCEGEGTRGGSGHCDCQAGYGGEACSQCGLGYFEAERNASHLVCSGR
jgi:hypothetical protein